MLLYCPGIGSLTAGMVGRGLSNTCCWGARKLASAAARLTAWFCDGQRAGLPWSRPAQAELTAHPVTPSGRGVAEAAAQLRRLHDAAAV